VWIKVILVVILLLAIIILGFNGNAIDFTGKSLLDVEHVQAVLYKLNSTHPVNQSISLTLEEWNEVNLKLEQVHEDLGQRLGIHVTAVVFSTLSLVMLIFVLVILSKKQGKERKPNATTPLNPKPADASSSNVHTYTFQPSPAVSTSPNPPSKDQTPSKRHSMMFEGALYEPWNQTTLDKLSAEAELPPAAKITRAAYRYGPVAGKIMARRYGHMLNPQELEEVNRILSLTPEDLLGRSPGGFAK